MPSNGNGSFSVDEWLVEPALNRISFQDESHYLRPQVMDLLVYLARRNGQVVSTEDLLTELWAGRVVSHGTVYNCIAELRQALTNGHDSSAEIQNIPKKGYRLVGKVSGSFEGAIPIADRHAGIERPMDRPGAKRATVLAIGAVVIFAAIGTFVALRPSSLSITAATQLSESQILFPPVPSSFPLVTDGSRLYFNDWVSGRLGLREMLTAGGDAIRMHSPFDDPETLINPQGVTPDGTDLMVTTFSPGSRTLPTLWLWPLLDGPPRQIGSAGSAIFSPDGSRIAYTNDLGELAIARPDMQEPKVLAALPGRIFWPVFSPDGTRIRFSLGRSGGLPNTLWEVSLDGGDARPLFGDWSARSHCCGSWTPDSEHFVFQAIDQGRSQIWAAAGSAGMFASAVEEPYLLTSGPIDFRRPTFSTDGERLFTVGWQLRGEVVQHDHRTGNFVAVPELASVSAEWLAYSGDRLAYVSYPDATLWVSGKDGSDPQQLSYSPLRALNPAWSPDGRTIVFEGLAPDRQQRIFRVDLDSRQVVQAMDGDGWQGSPTWSSDGRTIAFNEQGKDTIQLLDVETEEVTSLVDSEGMYAPRWSADGKFIATLGREGLELYNMSSGEREVIADGKPVEGHYWSRNSEHVYFYEPFWRADARSLYKVNIQSKVVEEVVVVGKVRSTSGIRGMWIGPGPNDEPMLLRDLSIHHIYTLDLSRD